MKNKHALLHRDVNEKHRAATPLELFYDLIYVVAIAQVALAFHHSYTHNHIGHGLINFFMVFLAIWWAWNQYAWFASSFDNNSIRFRLATFWQMFGALVLASGVEQAFTEGNFSVISIGYVIIRSSSIWLWFRVAMSNPTLKVTALRYAIGILLCQIGWITQNFFEFSYIIFTLLCLCEFFVPYYAESHTMTYFHSEHIHERLGLLTIIVLGESILAVTYNFKALIEHFSYELLFVAIGAIVTLFGIWWLYFNTSIEERLREKSVAFSWGYGHFIIFASAAAIGALISVNVDVLTHHAEISIEVANLGFAVAVALYLFGLWFTQERFLAKTKLDKSFMLILSLATIVLGFLPHSMITIGMLITLAVAYRQHRPL